jgi:chromosome segregation ATPase
MNVSPSNPAPKPARKAGQIAMDAASTHIWGRSLPRQHTDKRTWDWAETIQRAIDAETAAQERQIAQLMEVIAEKNRELEQARKERDDYHRKAIEIADQRDRAEEQAAQYRGDSLKYKAIAPKLADCEKALERVENEAKELWAVLQRIADYDAPDAHAMIEQARAVLAKYPGRE